MEKEKQGAYTNVFAKLEGKTKVGQKIISQSLITIMEKETLYLIWSNEHKGWWKAHHRGYTEQRKNAGMYTLDDALDICRSANIMEGDIPNEALVPVEVCAECGGTGEITTMERVYPDEGSPMAPIGSAPCPSCQTKNDDNE